MDKMWTLEGAWGDPWELPVPKSAFATPVQRICDTCAADLVPKAAFATPVQRICDTCAADLVPTAAFAIPVHRICDTCAADLSFLKFLSALELQPPNDAKFAKLAKLPKPAAQTLNTFYIYIYIYLFIFFSFAAAVASMEQLMHK